MGIPIMTNKIGWHNPTNSNFFLVTNTICSASMFKRLGDGDYSVFLAPYITELFNAIK